MNSRDRQNLDNWIMREQPVCECDGDCCEDDECCGKCQEEPDYEDSNEARWADQDRGLGDD